MKDKIRLSWGKAAAYNLPSAILIGHLSRKKMLLSKTASKKERKKEGSQRKAFSFGSDIKKKKIHLLSTSNPSPMARTPRKSRTSTAGFQALSWVGGGRKISSVIKLSKTRDA